MVRLLRFSVYYPLLLLSIVFLLTVVCALFIPRVHLKLDARSLVPANDSTLNASDVATRIFALHDFVIVGLANDRGIYNPATLEQVRKVSDELASIDGIIPSSVSSIATVPVVTVKDGKIDTRPPLTVNNVLDLAEAERIRHVIESQGLNNGIQVSPDGQATTIFSELRLDADRNFALQKARAIIREQQDSSTSIYLGGTGLAQAVLGQASALDLVRLIPVVIVVLGIGLGIAFKHPLPALLSLLEICVSLLLTIGLMGICRQSVFVTTLVLPIILVSVGVSDDVYALRHYFRELEKASYASTENLVIDVFESMIRPIGLTTLSTAIGLLSLTFTRLEPLIVFGAFGTLAICFSTLLTFSVVPALLTLIGPRLAGSRKSSSAKRDLKIDAIYRSLTAKPGRTISAVILIAVASVFLMTKLRVDDSWVKNLPANSDMRLGDEALNRRMAGTTTLDFMIDCGRPNGFLQAPLLLNLAAIENSVQSLPYVGATQSIFAEIVRVNAALRGMTYAAYRDALLKNELELGSGEIEQALNLLAVNRRTAADWIDKDKQRARITVFIRSADYHRIEQVIQLALSAGRSILGNEGRVTPFGDGWISYTTVHVLVNGQIRSVIFALLADLLLLGLYWRSVATALIAVIPVALSVLVVFDILAVSGTPLGIANSMFTGITIGIGMDFSIHLVAAYHARRRLGLSVREAMESAFKRLGTTIVTSAGTIALGFAVLLFSENTPNMQLGLMICLSLTVCAVATLILVPNIVLARGRKEEK